LASATFANPSGDNIVVRWRGRLNQEMAGKARGLAC
jgi:hypothetical protein